MLHNRHCAVLLGHSQKSLKANLIPNTTVRNQFCQRLHSWANITAKPIAILVRSIKQERELKATPSAQGRSETV